MESLATADQAELRSAEPLLRPASIALVGASERAASGWAKALFENLRAGAYPGPIRLINPRRESVWGLPCHPGFGALPEPVDLALVVVPAAAVPEVLEDGRAHGLRAAIVYASGFEDQGDGLRARVAAASRGPGGVRLCGPNGMGILALRERVWAYPVARVRGLPEGETGVVFSSGGSLQHWLRQAALRGLGFSYAISSGDELDLDLADYVSFLVDDPATRVVCVLAEGLRRPRAFARAARKALEARKPLLVVKMGRSRAAQAAAATHTGALAVDDAIFDALCDRYGIVRCPSLDDLLETAVLFRAGKLPAGSRVVVICHSGGIKGLFLDEAEDLGLELPALRAETAATLDRLEPSATVDNPYDAGATLAEHSERFRDVCEAILADPVSDVLAVQGRLATDTPSQHPPELFAALAARTEKPILAFERLHYNLVPASRTYQTQAELPFLMGIPATARAIAGLVRYGRRRARGAAPAALESDRPAFAPDSGAEARLRERLRALGVPPPREGLARDAGAAAALAAEIGFPVALKLASPRLLHKTEAGAVRLALADRGAVERAAEEMLARFRAASPGAPVDGFLVQEMVDGAELLVGARDDARFGPILAVGLGGVAAEALRDVALRLLPADETEIAELLDGLRGAALLGPFRGRPARDRAALVRAILGVGEAFLEARAALAELEINPLVVGAAGAGVRAVDVRTVRRS